MDIYNDDYILAEGEKNGLYKESLEKERMIGLKQRQTFQAAVESRRKKWFLERMRGCTRTASTRASSSP